MRSAGSAATRWCGVLGGSCRDTHETAVHRATQPQIHARTNAFSRLDDESKICEQVARVVDIHVHDQEVPNMGMEKTGGRSR